jgi:GH15 family glucan-1,4-alpha-glucosidase
LELAADGRSAHGTHRLRAGERIYLAFSYSREGPALLPQLGAAARSQIERSVHWWTGWAARCTYRGPYREAVVRSALTHVRLGHDALIFRYQGTDDGLPPGEGAFGIASFWAVECLAGGGNLKGATAVFEQLLTHANDVGLYAEEIDVGALGVGGIRLPMVLRRRGASAHAALPA